MFSRMNCLKKAKVCYDILKLWPLQNLCKVCKWEEMYIIEKVCGGLYVQYVV